MPSDVPRVAPRLHFRKLEQIGVAVIACFPLLAVVGAFGPNTAETRARTASLEVEVAAPRLTRVSLEAELVATIRNRDTTPKGPVSVSLTPTYLDDAEKSLLLPQPLTSYAFLLPELQPGEVRSIRVEFKPDRWGVRSGGLMLESGDERIVVPLKTVVLP